MSAASLLLLPKVFAAEETDWPEPVYFPQNVPQAPAAMPTNTKGQTPVNGTASEKKETHRKGRFWPFAGRAKQEPAQAISEDAIIKVGPKDPPASPYPLLRLFSPVLTNAGVINAGIYLVKPGEKPNAADDKASNQEEVSIILTRQNVPLHRLKLHASKAPDSDTTLSGTPSPISRTHPEKPEPLTVQAELSPDQKTIQILMKEGNHRYESEPFSVGIDQRPLLNF